jgi:hypothetical protein
LEAVGADPPLVKYCTLRAKEGPQSACQRKPLHCAVHREDHPEVTLWIVAGDLNEPQYTLQDGRIVTWGQEWNGGQGRFVCWERWKDRSGRCQPGVKWDGAVRWLFDEHDGHRLRHAYWEVHGHGAMAVSHVTRGQSRWFDHIFVSPDFRVEQCEYLHELRLERYSDHSPLSAKPVLDGQD